MAYHAITTYQSIQSVCQRRQIKREPLESLPHLETAQPHGSRRADSGGVEGFDCG